MADNSTRAPCGIDCSVCAIYVAAQSLEAAEKLAEEWRAQGMDKAEAGWFRCRGCRADRSLVWCEGCKIYACCVEEKGLEFCAQCEEFPCPEYEAWIGPHEHHRLAFEWLKERRGA